MNEETDKIMLDAAKDLAPPPKEPIDLDHVSVNDGPHYQPSSITSRFEVWFRGSKQTEVVEFCISEGWIRKYQKDWRGRAVTRGGDYVLGPRLSGPVEVFWKL